MFLRQGRYIYMFSEKKIMFPYVFKQSQNIVVNLDTKELCRIPFRVTYRISVTTMRLYIRAITSNES